MQPHIFMIDNYDSFTFNLVQYFGELGEEVRVIRNDAVDLAGVRALDPSAIVISPGPGTPDDAGISLEVLAALSGVMPIFGVCLGHQLLGLHAGAKVEVGPCIMHGKQSEIVHDGTGMFLGLPNPMRVGRYHSLVVQSKEDEPNPRFTVTSRGPEGEVMALRYNDRPWVGVQFHPESDRKSVV